MKIYPFIGLGEIRFTDNIKTVKKKLKEYDVSIGSRSFLNNSKATMFFPQSELYIVFKNKNGDEIDYFEVKKEGVSFDNINLLKTEYLFIQDYFFKLDTNIIFKEGGFDSPKYGLGVYRALRDGKFEKFPESIIIFNKSYLKEDVPSVDDIIKFYSS